MPQGEKTMPNIKKLAAAIALSTALTGGVVGVGAMTSAAAAGTTVAAGTSTFANGGGHWGWGHRRCAPWEHRLNRTKIRINNHTGHVRYRRVNGCAKIRHAESFLHGGHHGNW
ncbi:hypothetical protein GCM10018965_086320 [Nonomuraea roseola]